MPEVKFNPLYKFGQTVYLVTDPEQSECMVIGYELEAGGLILYKVRASDHDPSYHSAIELTKKKISKIVPPSEEEDD